MAEAVQPLTDGAKQFLASRFKDITKLQKEVKALPLAGMEAIESSDDLQIASEDAVYDMSSYLFLDSRKRRCSHCGWCDSHQEALLQQNQYPKRSKTEVNCSGVMASTS
ncbi:hypothetical protein YC2023_098088 [Brassica napus]